MTDEAELGTQTTLATLRAQLEGVFRSLETVQREAVIMVAGEVLSNKSAGF